MKCPGGRADRARDLAAYQATAALYSYCLGSRPRPGSGTHRWPMMMPLVPVADGNLVASLTQPSS